MINLFLYLAVFTAIINWFAVHNGSKIGEYLTKPTTMIFLLIYLWVVSGFISQTKWIAIAIIFSLIGDIILMLPGNFFLFGLSSFLISHIFYIIGLTDTLPTLTIPALILIISVIYTSALIFNHVRRGILATNSQKFLAPVFAYSIVIGMMLLSASFTLLRPEWNIIPAYLVTSGAVLFFFSDTMIAVHKFVAPITNRDVKVMISYHVGQTLLIVGSASHYMANIR